MGVGLTSEDNPASPATFDATMAQRCLDDIYTLAEDTPLDNAQLRALVLAIADVTVIRSHMVLDVSRLAVKLSHFILR